MSQAFSRRLSMLFASFLVLSFISIASGDANWKDVDALISQQKFSEALDKTKSTLKTARRSGDEHLVTESLIRATQLQMSLHGYETAVRFLKEEPWPRNPLYQNLLQLYYAHALMQYQEAYSWEIAKREKTVSTQTVDLRAWTVGQIGEEIRRSFETILKSDSALRGVVPDFYKPYLVPNTYPSGIRPTLRDVVIYLAVQHLADSTYWRPEESNEIYKLNFAGLAAIRNVPAGVALVNEKRHPLAKIASLLSGHIAFHMSAGRPEAALEARYELFRRLHAAAEQDDDKKAVREALRSVQTGRSRFAASANVEARSLAWWAAGQALLADFIRGENRPDRLIEARQEAKAGDIAFPRTVGAQMCAAIVAEIEAPQYEISTMMADGAERPSILIRHRNLHKIHFRAYSVDVASRLRSMQGNRLTPENEELLKAIETGKASAEWSVDLPETKDFQLHRTFATPPMKTEGAYVITASSTPDFRKTGVVSAATFVQTRLVLEIGNGAKGEVEVHVMNGETGRPAANVDVFLYNFSWAQPPSLIASQKSGGDGYVRFGSKLNASARREGSYFVVARQGASWAFDNSTVWFGGDEKTQPVRGWFIYTDRTVYRPEQTIQWKAALYRGDPVAGTYGVYPGASAEIVLYDLNSQPVARKTVKANQYGTASGEFRIPTGRPMGNWRLQATIKEAPAGFRDNYAYGTSIRVEEYKRPTFEASFKEAAEPMRLNRKARLTGEARYYFGQPVASGRVKWRVSRQIVWPWWWGFRGWTIPRGSQTPQMIATGSSTLKPDGTFDVDFTPEADEREGAKSPDLTYRFLVEADVTDDGGETRQASRVVRLGFVSVEARVDWEKEYFRESMPIDVSVLLSQLDGQPKKGTASYRIVRLDQPKETSLPADIQRVAGPDDGTDDLEVPAASSGTEKNAFHTSGDLRRARWETAWNWQSLVATWKENGEVSQGSISHDEKGVGKIRIEKGLEAGVYRVLYQTKDDFGATYKVSRDFIVASPKPRLQFPLLAFVERSSVPVGETARLLVHSGLREQEFAVEIYKNGHLQSRQKRVSGQDSSFVDIPIRDTDRGGFTVVVSGVRDYQAMRQEIPIHVPWDNKQLALEFSTFRDKVRPGSNETFRVTVKGSNGQAVPAGAAEVLTYMYDRSLDIFGEHAPPSPLSLYPSRVGAPVARWTLGSSFGSRVRGDYPPQPSAPLLQPDQLQFFASYGIGGPGARGGFGDGMAPMAMRQEAVMEADSASDSLSASAGPAGALKKKGMANEAMRADGELKSREAKPSEEGAPNVELGADALRTNFSETALWKPHLLTGADGSVSFEFKVPDSVTSWNVWAHAITKDLRSGSVSKQTQSIKELMVRPYVPRFLREGDQVELRATVNNASDAPQEGFVTFDIEDSETGLSRVSDFGLKPAQLQLPFRAAKGGSATVSLIIKAPKTVGTYAFKVTAKSKTFSDGEKRPVPVLPSRLHLAQSRFATLRDKETKTLEFKEMTAADDPSRVNERLVVTIDAQLFYGVLQAIPYLITYPYECTEQTLNRFLSTGIVTSVFKKYPDVAKMASAFSQRKTAVERFDEADANRRLTLEESPWLQLSQGGAVAEERLANVLDSRIAKAERDRSLVKLRKAQLPSGAFPWWQGGPPDAFMTLYILHGFARAAEFRVEVPKDMVVSGWRYMKQYFKDDVRQMMAKNCCWEFVTLLNYTIGAYPDTSWTGGVFTEKEREEMLAFSFKHWKDHSPYLKGYLALTLHRVNRASDGKLVWNSVMDSAKTDPKLGTYWAPEERSWLWYNDTIETHAFALRTLMELEPKDKRGEGLVQWLFLNKKLNHWKSTRATAEVIYALVHYLDQNAALGRPEDVTVKVGQQTTRFDFQPDKYTGKKNQVVIDGPKIDDKAMSKITFEKGGPGFAFASATWHFATDRLPKEEQGEFFNVSRRYFKRENVGREWVLKPMSEGAAIAVGDQIEVQISLRAKHEAEYVHLRDPRAAGLEPENPVSGYRWDKGIFWYEETRDSGANFFFSKLPVGEYTFKYRLRANMAGTFRVGPAEIQLMYAPEFNAYSTGQVLTVK